MTAPAVQAVTCGRCGDPLAGMVPTRDGLPAPVEARDPAGDLLVIQHAGTWVVRPVAAGETPDPQMRRRRHWCVYRHRCLGKAGRCPARGRLYATGTFCDGCAPRAPNG